jgi:hypothetical protein
MRVTNWTEQQLIKTERAFLFAQDFTTLKNISIKAVDDASMDISTHTIGHIKFKQSVSPHCFYCTIEFIEPMRIMRAGGCGATMPEALYDALEIMGFKFNSPPRDIEELIEAVLYDRDMSLVSLENI